MNPAKILIRGFIVLLILSSCTVRASTTQPITTKASTRLPVATRPIVTTSPTEITETTQTPAYAPTFTPHPSKSPTLTPTWTALPTLPPEMAEDYVEELMKTNMGCQLPCWWGIVPGKTEWASARHFLESFALEITPFGFNQFEVKYKLPEIYSPQYLSFRTDKVLVNTINIYPSVETSDTYQIDKLLSIYGAPSEVLVLYSWVGEEGILLLYLVLYYPNLGFLAEYVIESELVDGTYRSCPHGIGPELVLWSPSPDVKLTDVLSSAPADRFESFEDVTGMNITSFYNTFINASSLQCIEAKQP